MAYLYAQFINQVEDFCSYSQMSNCRKELTKHGLAKLHSMPEDHLDLMDPFQRGAHNISKYLLLLNNASIIHNNQKSQNKIFLSVRQSKTQKRFI